MSATPDFILGMVACWCDCTAATELDGLDEETREFVLADLEDSFDIVLDESTIAGCNTVGDLAALVARMDGGAA